MKKLKAILCSLGLHLWDKKADIIGEIDTCKRCPAKRRLIDIEAGWCGFDTFWEAVK